MSIHIKEEQLRQAAQRQLEGSSAEGLWGKDAEEILQLSIQKIQRVGVLEFIDLCKTEAFHISERMNRGVEEGGYTRSQKALLHLRSSFYDAICLALEEYLEQSSHQQ